MDTFYASFSDENFLDFQKSPLSCLFSTCLTKNFHLDWDKYFWLLRSDQPELP